MEQLPPGQLAPNVGLFGGLLVENVIPPVQTGLSSFFLGVFARPQSLCSPLRAFAPPFGAFASPILGYCGPSDLGSATWCVSPQTKQISVLLGTHLKKEPMEVLNMAQDGFSFIYSLHSMERSCLLKKLQHSEIIAIA